MVVLIDEYPLDLLTYLIRHLKDYGEENKIEFEYKVEYPYEIFNKSGFIDLIFWSDTKETIKLLGEKMVVLYKINQPIQGLRETIRQINRSVRYIESGKDPFFDSKFKNNTITSSLVMFASRDNLELILKNKEIIQGARIDNIWFFNKETIMKPISIPPKELGTQKYSKDWSYEYIFRKFLEFND